MSSETKKEGSVSNEEQPSFSDEALEGVSGGTTAEEPLSVDPSFTDESGDTTSRYDQLDKDNKSKGKVAAKWKIEEGLS